MQNNLNHTIILKSFSYSRTHVYNPRKARLRVKRIVRYEYARLEKPEPEIKHFYFAMPEIVQIGEKHLFLPPVWRHWAEREIFFTYNLFSMLLKSSYADGKYRYEMGLYLLTDEVAHKSFECTSPVSFIKNEFNCNPVYKEVIGMESMRWEEDFTVYIGLRFSSFKNDATGETIFGSKVFDGEPVRVPSSASDVLFDWSFYKKVLRHLESVEIETSTPNDIEAAYADAWANLDALSNQLTSELKNGILGIKVYFSRRSSEVDYNPKQRGVILDKARRLYDLIEQSYSWIERKILNSYKELLKDQEITQGSEKASQELEELMSVVKYIRGFKDRNTDEINMREETRKLNDVFLKIEKGHQFASIMAYFEDSALTHKLINKLKAVVLVDENEFNKLQNDATGKRFEFNQLGKIMSKLPDSYLKKELKHNRIVSTGGVEKDMFKRYTLDEAGLFQYGKRTLSLDSSGILKWRDWEWEGKGDEGFRMADTKFDGGFVIMHSVVVSEGCLWYAKNMDGDVEIWYIDLKNIEAGRVKVKTLQKGLGSMSRIGVSKRYMSILTIEKGAGVHVHMSIFKDSTRNLDGEYLFKVKDLLLASAPKATEEAEELSKSTQRQMQIEVFDRTMIMFISCSASNFLHEPSIGQKFMLLAFKWIPSKKQPEYIANRTFKEVEAFKKVHLDFGETFNLRFLFHKDTPFVLFLVSPFIFQLVCLHKGKFMDVQKRKKIFSSPHYSREYGGVIKRKGIVPHHPREFPMGAIVSRYPSDQVLIELWKVQLNF